MKKLAFFAMFTATLMFTGCATSTGQFLWDNKVAVYKVVTKGVTTFMTKKQIEEKQLDKAADLIEYVYSIDTSTGKVIGAITE
ncbi:MAG: hypothetical protein PQJ49_05070 [Sphaerochaetaceae bacterium]|nr:hypothetical protein [Sphaerochaetaceae bacterium]